MEKNEKKTIWTLPFILILVINSLNAISSYMVNPVLPTFLQSKGAPFELTGIISSLLSWVAMFARPFSGAASDRFDRKKLMLISYMGTGLCTFLYSCTDNLGLLVAIRVVNGIFFSLSGTISMSFSTSFIPVEMIGEGLGYISISSLVSTTLGPLIGDWVQETFNGSVVFVVACLFNVLSCAVIMMLPYTFKKKKTEKFQLKLTDLFEPKLIVYVFLVGLFSFGNGILSYYLKSFGTERGIENITLFYTVNSAAMFIVKPLSGKLQDKKGIAFILYPAYVITAIAYTLLANAYTLIPVLVAGVLKAMGQGIGSPAIQAESVKKCGVERSGVAISTCYIGQDIGNAIGPIFASTLIPKVGYGNMFYCYVLLLAIGEVVFFFQHQKEKKQAAA